VTVLCGEPAHGSTDSRPVPDYSQVYRDAQKSVTRLSWFVDGRLTYAMAVISSDVSSAQPIRTVANAT